MSNLHKEETLPPDKLAALEQLLRKKGINVPQTQTIPRRATSQRLPLSFSQQRLWFLDQLEPGSAAFNLATVMRMQGELDVAALRGSLQEVIRRHESLRTTFLAVDGQPEQVIQPEISLPLPVVDLSALPVDRQESETQRLLQQETNYPFDLARGPLLRVTMLRLGVQHHVILQTMHHIISDGWSMRNFTRELTTLYAAFKEGKASALSPLPIQYADFAVWQQEWLQGEVLERQLDYWKHQLTGLEPLNLPTDRPRPAVQTTHGAHQLFHLSIDITQKLKALCQREGVTLFMLLLAAFQVLLARYTEQEDIAVGTFIANRNRADIEDLIGFFVNTLVMRTDLSGNPTFLDLLKRVKDVTLGAYAHQDVPSEKVLEALQLERDTSRSPLFQVMFSMPNAPTASRELVGLTMQPLSVENHTAKFDVTLTMVDGSQGLRGSLEYNTDLFDSSTIVRMLEHWQVLLEGIVAQPDRPIAALPLLTGSEQHQVLIAWNETEVDMPLPQCVQESFEAQVRRTPDAVAIVHEAHHLTYQALDQRSNQLAHYLQRQGVGPDARVGVYAAHTLEVFVGLLGILKAGGAYVPLDPTYPAERLAFMVHEAQMPVLLTQERYQQALPATLAQVLCLDSEWTQVASCSQEAVVSQGHPEQLAYVIYTSGSTGKPKGVAMPHRPLLNLFAAQARQLGLSSAARTLQCSSPSFDILFNESFSAWQAGGSLHIVEEQMRRDGVELLCFLREQNIEWVFLPFSILAQIAEAAQETGQRPQQLRAVLSTAEALQITPGVRALFAALPTCTLHNEYGPSESHVVTWLTLPSTVEEWSALPPIGRPLQNCQVYVLDQHLHPVPIGVPGELYLGGMALARGYLDRPELTAEKFVPHPYSKRPGERLYKTGDQVRSLPDGSIEYLGRIDQQVKLRGYRIELGEIEAVLEQHPAVRAGVAQVREDRPGDQRLVAYVVPRQAASLTPSELRAYLQGKVPGYMLPSAIVLLEELPLTPSGKLDRRALYSYNGTQSQPEEDVVLPRTPVEEVLASIWKELLGSQIVGIHDNFFSLGGHSLLATRIISRMRAAFGVDIPLSKLFEMPTIAELAKLVEAFLTGQNTPVPPIKQVSRKQHLPLSFAQQRLWLLDQLEPGKAFYNIPIAVKMNGALDIVSFQRSIQEIVCRHESLRTVFKQLEGSPVQRIIDELEIPLSLVDLRPLTEDEREREAQHLVNEEAAYPFDLEHGPLLRVTLLQLSKTQHILLLTMHHIVSDAWSQGILIDELCRLYEAFCQGLPSPLAPLPIQYADFAAWQRERLQGQVLEQHLDYWKQQLQGARPLDMPTDAPRLPQQSYQGASYLFSLPQELTTELRQVSQRHTVTLFMTLLSAFQVLLWRWSGQSDVVVGTDIANRTSVESEGLIGFFVNLLALRSDLGGSPRFSNLLEQVRRMVLDAYSHQDLPFEMLVEQLRLSRQGSQVPLVRVLFVLQNAPTGHKDLAGIQLESMGNQVTAAKFDLAFFVVEGAERLRIRVNYSRDLFEEPTIHLLCERFAVLLSSIVEQPDLPIEALEIQAPEEKARKIQEETRQATERKESRGGHRHKLKVAKGKAIDLI